jgi:hypothetical protein
VGSPNATRTRVTCKEKILFIPRRRFLSTDSGFRSACAQLTARLPNFFNRYLLFLIVSVTMISCVTIFRQIACDPTSRRPGSIAGVTKGTRLQTGARTAILSFPRKTAH